MGYKYGKQDALVMDIQVSEAEERASSPRLRQRRR